MKGETQMYGNAPFYSNPFMAGAAGAQIQPNGQRIYQPPYQAPYQPQIPQTAIQPQIPSQQPQVACEIVSDFETIRAANPSLDGQPKYYLMSDGAAIYRKQLMPDGTSKIFKYSLAKDDENAQTISSSNDVTVSLKAIETKMDTLNTRMNEFMNMWGGNGNDNES